MDKNGDARVTKKELFTVLRQYSGTVNTEEVSEFVKGTDDDKDEKIDYREFTMLFPQVKGRSPIRALTNESVPPPPPYGWLVR